MREEGLVGWLGGIATTASMWKDSPSWIKKRVGDLSLILLVTSVLSLALWDLGRMKLKGECDVEGGES